jgi:hypothetical protein
LILTLDDQGRIDDRAPTLADNRQNVKNRPGLDCHHFGEQQPRGGHCADAENARDFHPL